jgi:hypothetical protein
MTFEWRAKRQVRSLSLYLPLQVLRGIVRLWSVGNLEDRNGIVVELCLAVV